MLTLSELYSMQKALDDYILRDKQISKRELLTNTLLALVVEVSELANATRSFKHWSNKGAMDREVLLEEYSDCLHFFLSLGNQLGFTPIEVEEAYKRKNQINYQRQKEGY